MKLNTLITYVDDIKPNAFSDLTKVAWVNECEGLVQTEVMLLSVTDVITYSEEDLDEDRTLLAEPPHDKIYWVYLSAMIDFANGEYNKYQNTMQLFNAYFGEYMRWFAQTYRPADGEAIKLGYYLSAYAIAVNHGFGGTEEEWLENLKGETIEIRYSGEYDRIEYRYPSDTEWEELLKMSDLRGEAFQAAVTAAENSAKLSESWAVGGTGKRTGEDTDNAKHYAAQAAQSATGAAGSAAAAESSRTGASGSAKLSESWAVGGTGTRTGEDTNNARHYASQAAQSAAGAAASAGSAQSSSQNAYQDALRANTAKEEAAGHKTSAEGSAKLSESWAVGGTGTRSGEDTNNAKYWAQQAAAAAGGGVSSFNGRTGIVTPMAGDYTAAMVGAAAPGKAFTITLSTSGWTNNSQTIRNADFLSSGYVYLIESSPDNYAAYRDAGVYADNIETNGEITFHCEELPSVALTANILRIEVKA